MYKLLGSIAAIAALSGCGTVSHSPLSAETSAKLQGKTFAVAQRPTPDFTAFTAGKAAFAILGAGAMISEGNAIIKDNEVEDPARAIAKGLAAKLTTSRQMRDIQLTPSTIVSDDAAAIASAMPGADYVVEVKTLGWMFNYYPTDWAHYRVSYSGRLRVIDSLTKKVISETACSTVQGDDKNPPSKDQLLENKAAMLKQLLDKAATACVGVLARDALQLN